MTVTPGTAIDSREFGERYTAFQNQMGQSACLIELGLSVDQECEHGNIPSGRHPNPKCGCWPVTHSTEPEREQHMAALREGNARRLEMAAYRRHLRSLTTDDAIREVTYALKRMDDAPAYVTRLRVEWLLASIPAVGPMKRDRLLFKLQASGQRRLADLTARQREKLCTMLLDRAWL